MRLQGSQACPRNQIKFKRIFKLKNNEFGVPFLPSGFACFGCEFSVSVPLQPWDSEKKKEDLFKELKQQFQVLGT